MATDVALEVSHVLFMDVVGYSKLLINDQTEVQPKALGYVAICDAGLGNNEEALREGRKAQELWPKSRDYHSSLQVPNRWHLFMPRQEIIERRWLSCRRWRRFRIASLTAS
jgi:hypothetical protein